jgi:hypothetical protein
VQPKPLMSYSQIGVDLRDLYTLDFGAAQRMSVDYWLDLMRNHPANLVGAVLRPLWDSLFVAFQALSIAGIVATVIVNRASLARLWFFLVFLSLPYVSIVFFSPGATARGYLAYSSAFILFASRADGKGRRNSCRGGLRHRSDGRFPSASGIFSGSGVLL